MDRRSACGLVLAIVALSSTPLSAQAPSEVAGVGHATTVAIAAGAGSDGVGSGTVVAGTVGWQVDSRASVVSTFQWCHQGEGADAFAGAFAIDVNLLPRRAAAPFVAAGFGLYRTFYDVARSPMPAFYRDRVDISRMAGTTVSFVDPAMVIGAGVNILTTPHVALRPQVEAFVVARGSQRHVTVAVTVRIAYSVEHQPFK